MQETLVQFLGWEDPLEKGTGVYSPRGHKESDTTERLMQTEENSLL